MGFMPRMRYGEGEGGWFHVYGSIGCRANEYPLAEPLVQDKFLSILRFYTNAFSCQAMPRGVIPALNLRLERVA